MCIIIDANKAADFCKQEKPYLNVLLRWIATGGRVASGGHLERELFKVHSMKALLLEWSRSGKLIRVPQERVAAREALVRSQCRSDDPHVVALAIETSASIVVTEDKNLIIDLRDRSLVGRRRRIYKENSASPSRVDRHTALLQRSDCP